MQLQRQPWLLEQQKTVMQPAMKVWSMGEGNLQSPLSLDCMLYKASCLALG